MPYVNDAQTLADVVGPASAADALQTQQAQAQQEQAIKNQVAAGQAPAEIQKPGLMNALTQAQAYAEQGLGMQQQAKGLVDMYGAPSAAQALVAGNQATMTADQAKKLGSLGQIAGQVAGLMDSVPPPARPAYMQQLLQQQGVDAATLGPLASGDPDTLRQFSAKAIQASADYQTRMAEEAQRVQGEENVAGITGAAHLQATQELTRGREEVAQTNAEVKRQMAPVQAIVGQLTTKAAAGTATPQELAILKWAQGSQQLIRSGSPFQAGITGTQVQSNIPDVPQVQGQQSQQSGTNAPAQQAPDQNAIAAEMRRRGLLK